MFASVYVLTFLFRGAGVVAPEASALAVAACASRTLFAACCRLSTLAPSRAAHSSFALLPAASASCIFFSTKREGRRGLTNPYARVRLT